MTKSPKRYLLAGVIFFSAFTAAFAFAASDAEMLPELPHKPMGPMGGPGMNDMDPLFMGGPAALGPVWMLDLDDGQRKKINKLQDDLRRSNWAAMGTLMDLQAKMRDLYLEAQPNSKAVGEIYSQIAELRRPMIERNVETMNQIRKLLTETQLQELKTLRRNVFVQPHQMRGPIHQGSVTKQ